MISFASDYTTGAHPEILRRLAETNFEHLPGYGTDVYCERAKEKIRAAVGLPEAEVEFIAGGTQTNAVVISSMLSDHEGVIAATTGHVNTHEAGAIEYTGHKVLALPQKEGKLRAADVEDFLSSFFADPSREHMVFPGMVYLSHPTEYGTVYSKKELEEISSLCRGYGITLFLEDFRYGKAGVVTGFTVYLYHVIPHFPHLLVLYIKKVATPIWIATENLRYDHPYVGIIQIRLMGRRLHLPLSRFIGSPLFKLRAYFKI